MKAFVLFAVLLSPWCCFAQRYDAEASQDAVSKDRLDHSISVYTNALSSDPRNPTNYFQRGMAELKRSSFEKQPMEDKSIDPAFQHFRDAAIADFTKTIELQPTNSEAYDQRGLAKEDCFAGFDADFDKAIALDPKNALAYLHRGLNDGCFRPNSIDDFTVAIGIDPNCAAAYFYRAEAKQYVKNFDGTIEDLSKCISLNPQMVMPYQLRAYSEFEKGDLAAAEADYQKLTELRPQEDFWWSELAGMKTRQRDFEGAISALNKAIKLNPRGGGYVTARADIKRERGDYQGALDDYRTALNESLEGYDQVSTRFSIWECEARLGGRSTANKHLSHYVRTLTGPYSDWNVKIGRFLLNESNPQSFLSDATKAGQTDQAQHFIDLRKQIIGN